MPRKNIKLLAGKPLIAYAIQTALASSLIDRVIVSTEDVEIAQIALQFGAEVPFMRPAELASDYSSEWLTWQHAIQTLNEMDGSSKMGVFVCVSPTSPLRSVADVDACIRALLESDADLVITAKTAERNTYYNMVTLDDFGYASLASAGPSRIHRRQDAPAMYDMTTVAYAARPDYVLKADWMFEGKLRAVLVPAERALDIDTELDFAFAEFLLTEWQPRQPQISKDVPGQLCGGHRCAR